VAGIGCFVTYAITPYTAGPEGLTDLLYADSRYVVPGLVLGAAAVALLGVSTGATIAVAIALVVSSASGLPSSLDVDWAWSAAVVAAVALLAALAAWRPDRGRLDVRRSGVQAAIGVGLIGVVLAGVAGLADRFEARLGAGDDPVLAGLAADEREQRIALAGSWGPGTPPVRSAFGSRLGNEVSYVGPVVDAALLRYQTGSEWRAHLRDGEYDLLLVGRLDVEYDHALDWSRGLDAPLVGSSDRFLLYDLRG
jgi:membrane protein implicated in regulation of membrane protease activity